MAPRKRTTNAKSKKNPKIPKLEAFLLDFDSEVTTIIERLNEKANNLLKDADNHYNMALIKLPVAVRQMNWIQFCDSEKTETPVDNSKQRAEAADVELILAPDHSIPPKSTKKATKTSANSEDEENLEPKKKGKSKKAPPTSKKTRALSVSKQNSAIKRSSRKPLVTPARSLLDASIIGATPLITPRFDSRLPKTPAVRVPRHREKVYSISVNGSPIAGGTEDIVINVPLGNGECVQLLASEINSVDLSQLDAKVLGSIRQLQTRLTTLCGTSK